MPAWRRSKAVDAPRTGRFSEGSTDHPLAGVFERGQYIRSEHGPNANRSRCIRARSSRSQDHNGGFAEGERTCARLTSFCFHANLVACDALQHGHPP